MIRTCFGCFFSVLVLAPLPAQVSFLLRNTDTSAVLDYWALPGTPSRGPALAALPLAPGGRHPVAPGETVRVVLPAGHSLVGTFVPWLDSPTLLTPVFGGLILAAEAPSKGTLLVDRAGFKALNASRGWESSLQEWGLTPSPLVLDGRSADWNNVPNLMEWGALFQPGERWPAGWPRPRSLQAVLRDGALWVRLTFETIPFPAGQASLLLRRSGGALEWPLTGADFRVLRWDLQSEPLSVGKRLLAAGMMEAWIPWDRIPPAEAAAWQKSEGTWSFVVATGTQVRSYELGSSRWEDLP